MAPDQGVEAKAAAAERRQVGRKAPEAQPTPGTAPKTLPSLEAAAKGVEEHETGEDYPHAEPKIAIVPSRESGEETVEGRQ